MTSITHWNLKGVKDKRNPNYQKKVDIVSHLLSNPSKNLIVSLQETHLESKNQIPSEWTNFSHLFSLVGNFAPNNDSFSGTMLFINKLLTIEHIEVLIPGRVILVQDGKSTIRIFYKLNNKMRINNMKLICKRRLTRNIKIPVYGYYTTVQFHLL